MRCYCFEGEVFNASLRIISSQWHYLRRNKVVFIYLFTLNKTIFE